MADLNFCPYCNAAHFKIIGCSNELFFCRECNRFFKFASLELKCLKCDHNKIMRSEFPSPKGETVFQCAKCRKAWPASEFFKGNKVN